MQKIIPHLWFDKEAKEAGEFYVSVFKEAQVRDVTVLHGTPSGSVDIVTIEVYGQMFMLLAAGPFFKFTPAISFFIACATKEEVDTLWNALIPGGAALMELDAYPFSERYGWLQDKYGLSWQVMYMGDYPITQKIIPTLMFVGEQCGRAEEAMQLYTSIFPNASITGIMRYDKGEEPDREGTVKHAGFRLEGQEFAAMDSAHKHKFSFNEAISLMVQCDTQEEIDHYWEKLSADPSAEQCGWLKDKFGVSWQIVPAAMEEMFKEKDEQKLARVTQAMLQMKKLDIAKLEEAARGEDN